MESKSSESINLGGDDEINIEETGSSEDVEFDTIVGEMEDVIMSDEFQSAQNAFCDRHCGVFTPDSENKPEYMDIFNEYTRLIEYTINNMMIQRIPTFRMGKFEEMIEERPDEISSEIFDTLASMGDFVEFKDLMLNYKRQNSMSQRIDLSLTGTHVA